MKCTICGDDVASVPSPIEGNKVLSICGGCEKLIQDKVEMKNIVVRWVQARCPNFKDKRIKTGAAIVGGCVCLEDNEPCQLTIDVNSVGCRFGNWYSEVISQILEQILEQTKAEQEYRKESFKDLEKAGVFKRIEEKLE